MNNPKIKLIKQINYITSSSIKVWNKLNERSTRTVHWTPQNTVDRRLSCIRRCINRNTTHVHRLKHLILRWQHSLNWSTKKIYDSFQNPSWLFGRKLQADPKIHMELQWNQKSKNNVQREKQGKKSHTLILKLTKKLL